MKMIWATATATLLTGLATPPIASAAAGPGVIANDPSSNIVATSPYCDMSSLNQGSYAYWNNGNIAAYSVSVKQAAYPSGTVTYSRCYILYIPNKAISRYKSNHNYKAPMVILLHGGNDDYVAVLQPQTNSTYGTGIASSLWVTTADADATSPSYGQSLADYYGIVVAVPNGTNDGDTTGTFNGTTASYGSLTSKQHWNDCSGFNPGFTVSQPVSSSNQLALWTNNHFYAQKGSYQPVDDVAFINAMIAQAEQNAGLIITGSSANNPIDTTSIYAVGASDGGNMALRLAREDSGKIAAAAASLAGDGAQGTQPTLMYPVGTYQSTADQNRGTGDPAACVEPSDPAPVMLIKGAPAPDNYNPANTTDDTLGTTLYTSGDQYLAFNGGCGLDSSLARIKAYGCWLPFDRTDQFSMNLGLNQFDYGHGGSGVPATVYPTTLGNWLHRNNLADANGVLNSTTSLSYVAITTDPNKTDGEVNNSAPGEPDSRVGGLYDSGGSTTSSGVPAGTCRDYYSNGSKAHEIEYCVVYRNGHIDPSLAITAQNSSAYEPALGNQNQDFETATAQWLFLKNHHVSSGVHQ